MFFHFICLLFSRHFLYDSCININQNRLSSWVESFDCFATLATDSFATDFYLLTTIQLFAELHHSTSLQLIAELNLCRVESFPCRIFAELKDTDNYFTRDSCAKKKQCYFEKYLLLSNDSILKKMVLVFYWKELQNSWFFHTMGIDSLTLSKEWLRLMNELFFTNHQSRPVCWLFVAFYPSAQ